MKLALFSDLHTEFISGSQVKSFLDPMLQSDAECVVLAGDIASGRTNVKQVLGIFAKVYPHVIYVAGNHEYYGSSLEKFNTLNSLPSNVHFLNPGCVQINDVKFIGASLWTNFRDNPLAMSAAYSMINDFRRIKGFSPNQARKLFYRDMDFIKSSVTPGKKVIVTHFLPAIECIHERFSHGGLINNYFANDLTDYIEHLSDTTWLFGHTHDSVDITIGTTNLHCNPYGYAYRDINPNFNSRKEIEI